MVKERISISVDSILVALIDEKVAEGIYRNRSHCFELSARKQLNIQEYNLL